MVTYDIYEVYYHGKVSDYLESGNELDDAWGMNDYILEHGDWDSVFSTESKVEAWRKWSGTWSELAGIEVDECDSDIFSAVIYRFECSQRDENMDITDSWDIDESICRSIADAIKEA